MTTEGIVPDVIKSGSVEDYVKAMKSLARVKSKTLVISFAMLERNLSHRTNALNSLLEEIGDRVIEWKTLQTPQVTLQTKQGSADDKLCLLSSICFQMEWNHRLIYHRVKPKGRGYFVIEIEVEEPNGSKTIPNVKSAFI